MNILINIPVGMTKNSFMDTDIINRLRSIGSVTENKTENNVIPELSEVDILITGWGQPKLTNNMLGERLKLIVHTGGTVGSLVDLDAFNTGVKIISGNQYYAESVAEGVLAYMMFALRHLGYYSEQLKNGNWCNNEKTEGLLDQTVGIVSFGAISRRLIEMAKPFRIKFKVFSNHQNQELANVMGFEYASLEEIFSTCKIVSVHTAAKPDTENFIDKPLLSLLKKGSIFINTSRGMVVNESSLIEELKTGRFRAILDVYKQEPLSKDSKLLSLDNAILFPHHAGPTYDRRKYITNCLINDIERFLAGKEMHNEISKEMASAMTRTR